MPFDKKSYDLQYQKEHLVQLKLNLHPNEKAMFSAAAQASGLSVRQYLLRLVAADAAEKGVEL